MHKIEALINAYNKKQLSFSDLIKEAINANIKTPLEEENNALELVTKDINNVYLEGPLDLRQEGKCYSVYAQQTGAFLFGTGITFEPNYQKEKDMDIVPIHVMMNTTFPEFETLNQSVVFTTSNYVLGSKGDYLIFSYDHKKKSSPWVQLGENYFFLSINQNGILYSIGSVDKEHEKLLHVYATDDKQLREEVSLVKRTSDEEWKQICTQVRENKISIETAKNSYWKVTTLEKGILPADIEETITKTLKRE